MQTFAQARARLSGEKIFLCKFYSDEKGKAESNKLMKIIFLSQSSHTRTLGIP